ncbi:MAG: N-acetyltransferase [Anaerolineae bacterium]|nr:N-acetyltransferase [Anaerolineae bacterium]
MDLGDGLALADYRLDNGTIYFTHTEVPPAHEGQGIAGKVVKAALEYAKAQNLRVVPICPYVVKYIQRHPEYQPLTQ